MAAIFKIFQIRYGSKWVSSIDGIEGEAVSEWAKGLKGVSDSQVKYGLDRWAEEWPPSLPEFIAACKNVKPQAHRNFPKLEVIRSDKKTALAAIQNMRNLYL